MSDGYTELLGANTRFNYSRLRQQPISIQLRQISMYMCAGLFRAGVVRFLRDETGSESEHKIESRARISSFSPLSLFARFAVDVRVSFFLLRTNDASSRSLSKRARFDPIGRYLSTSLVAS